MQLWVSWIPVVMDCSVQALDLKKDLHLPQHEEDIPIEEGPGREQQSFIMDLVSSQQEVVQQMLPKMKLGM